MPLGHLSIAKLAASCAGVVLLTLCWVSSVTAEQPNGGAPEHRRGPVYQRHAFGGSMQGRGAGHSGSGHEHFAIVNVPPMNAGSFQRPYPYHLDYYRMRYGGSYEPYFGNLYGPPQVVTAPPYYGAYYGGYGGLGAGYAGGYGPGPPCCPCDKAAVDVEQGSNGVAE